MYMEGASYAEMAKVFLSIPVESPVDNARSSASHHPIPKIFGFLRQIVYRLSIDVGCLVAVYELGVMEQDDSLPDSLQALPLCICNGCDSIGALAWYRFGYRERMCAHAFQRVFPLPENLVDDSSRAEWVRDKRREWLKDEIDTPVYPLLNDARIVIENSEYV